MERAKRLELSTSTLARWIPVFVSHRLLSDYNNRNGMGTTGNKVYFARFRQFPDTGTLTYVTLN